MIQKITVLFLAAAMLLSCTACSLSIKKESAADPSEAVPSFDPDAAFAADFTDKLYAVSQDCHPGTAGSSLRAAALAAEMMDIFTQFNPSADVIRSAVKEFAETLTGDAAADFPVQLEAVSGASVSLTAEGGKELLDCCGYAGQGYPWDADAMAACFAAVKLD